MVDFGLSIAVTASVAALITFVANALIRRATGPASLGIALVAALFAMAQPGRAAVDLRFDQAVHVAEDETIERTLVVTGDSLVVDGTVKGNVVAFSERVAVRGVIEGELFSAGRELELSGEVKGNVHAFGEQARIAGKVDGSAFIGFDRVTITGEAEIDEDAGIVTGRLLHEGRVGRDLTTGAALAELRGAIGRHAEFWGERLEARSGGSVAGDFTAHVRDAEDVQLDDGYQVAGATDVRVGDRVPHVMSHYRDPSFYLWRVVWLAAAFVVGLLLHTMAPWLLGGGLTTGAEFFRTLGFGFALLVLVPVALVLLALTVVGVPLAVIGVAAYAVGWYLAGIAVAALVGRAVTRPASDSRRDFGLALLAGLVLVAIAYHLPWIGGLLHFLGLLLGFGLLFERGREAWEGRRAAAY
jgi:cytoskeletal protein CcmA (bactofilin family)